MKIGIFDSGLGGLFVLKELRNVLRNKDFVYLGDTQNLPYGNKSQEQIYQLTKNCVDWLFNQNCCLVLVACNTASSKALRRLQQEYLPNSPFKDRRILGIIRPTVEEVSKFSRLGLIGTRRTVDSGAYLRELENLGWQGTLIAKSTPKLAEMVETGQVDQLILNQYLNTYQTKRVEALVLACTHYGCLKPEIAASLPAGMKIIAQEKLLPGKLKAYLKKHPKILRKLSKKGTLELYVTKASPRYRQLANSWFGTKTKLKSIKI